MTHTEALKLALDLSIMHHSDPGYSALRVKVQFAIKEALAHPTSGDYALGYAEGFNDACKKPAKPQQEPMAKRPQNCGTGYCSCIECVMELPQQQQEPVVWMYQDKSTHEVQFQKHMRAFVDHSKTSEVPLYSEPLANHELQCVCGAVWCGDEMVHLPNKAPPQRKPLTDDEIWNLASNCLDSVAGRLQFARAIEAAYGIKGDA